MVTPVVITDPRSKNKATVTEFGQLIVAPVAYSTPYSVKMDANNTAYNLVSPVDNKSIVITGVILTANKNVGAGDATIVLYYATTSDTLTPVGEVVSLEMKKNTSLPLTGLNLIIPKGNFLLAKTDDNDVFISIGYYRVPT